MLLDEGRRFRVIVMCAWCEQEGRPAGLGERAPLDDQSKTHGICRRHAIELLNRLPSRSFPGVRLLLVVSQAQAALYEFLARELAGVSGVRVMMERRRSDRRIVAKSVPAEKRRAERRVREGEVYAPGYTVIRFGGSSR